MPDRPAEVTWEVMVDWDATDWAAEPDFSEEYDDISDDVNFNGWSRGEIEDEGNIPPGTHEIQLRPGLHLKYSCYNDDPVTGPLYGKIRPWLPIRIRATHNGVTYPVFAGFIEEIAVDPRPDRQSVTITVTDGSDLLARQLVAQDYDERTQMSDGDAAKAVLDAAGWPFARRNLDGSGGEILSYPETGQY